MLSLLNYTITLAYAHCLFLLPQHTKMLYIKKYLFIFSAGGDSIAGGGSKNPR